MEAIGLLVTLEARQGKAADAEAFLKSAQALALDEKGTLKWYAIKLGPGKFGIFDTFANEGGRNAHLTGEIAKALGARANELLAVPPQIEKVVLASTPLPQPTLERLGIIHGNKNWPKKEWLLNRALLVLASRVPVSPVSSLPEAEE
jgi:quinol monooxygenase YgiN